MATSTERSQKQRTLDRTDPERKNRKLNSIWLFGDVELAAALDLTNVVWFRGVDVARALEFKDPKASLSKHLRKEQNKLNSLSYEELSKKLPSIFLNLPNVKSNTTFINEQELYNFINKSYMPKAQAFSSWVSGTVLPSIRATGKYEVAKEDNPLSAINEFIAELNRREERHLAELARRDIEFKQERAQFFAELHKKDQHVENMQKIYLDKLFVLKPMCNMPLNDKMKNEYFIIYRKFSSNNYPNSKNMPKYPYYTCRVQHYSIDGRKKQLLKIYPDLVELCCLKVANSVNYFNYIVEQMEGFISRGSTKEHIQSFRFIMHKPTDDLKTFLEKEANLLSNIKKIHAAQYECARE